MTFLFLTPAVLSLLLLAAHFSRAGWLSLSIFSLAMIALVAVPRRWAALTLQVVLVLGALEWVRTIVVLVQARMEAGMPATRMAIILGCVVLVTLGAAALFRTSRLQRRFR